MPRLPRRSGAAPRREIPAQGRTSTIKWHTCHAKLYCEVLYVKFVCVKFLCDGVDVNVSVCEVCVCEVVVCSGHRIKTRTPHKDVGKNEQVPKS